MIPANKITQDVQKFNLKNVEKVLEVVFSPSSALYSRKLEWDDVRDVLALREFDSISPRFSFSPI